MRSHFSVGAIADKILCKHCGPIEVAGKYVRKYGAIQSAKGDRRRVTVARQLGHDLFGEVRRLPETPHEPERPHFVAKHREADILAKPVAERPVARRIVVLIGHLQAVESVAMPPSGDQRRPHDALADHQKCRIALPIGNFEVLVSQVFGNFDSRRNVIRRPEPVQNREALYVGAGPECP